MLIYNKQIIINFCSDLNDEEHDKLVLYKIHENEELNEKIRTKLPIQQVVSHMTSFVPDDLKVS